MRGTVRQQLGDWDETQYQNDASVEFGVLLQAFGWLEREQARSVPPSQTRQLPGSLIMLQQWRKPSEGYRFTPVQQSAVDTVLGLAFADDVAAKAPEAEDANAALQALWSLVSGRQLSEARRLLNSLPSSPSYERARRLLRPPTLRRVQRPGVERTREYKWLAEHGKDYSRQWVALSGENLIAAEPTLQALLSRIRELALPSSPLVHYVE